MARSALLGITMGDPAGIGPEIVLKALTRMSASQRAKCRVIGCQKVFAQEEKRLATRVNLSVVDDSVKDPGRYSHGRPQKNCGRAALAALECGVDLLRRGEFAALVTAPVSKQALRLAGFSWPGQTEFLADRLGAAHHAMLAWTPRFKTVFVTIHLPLALVSRRITPETVLEKATLLDQFLRQSAICNLQSAMPKRPRLCVLAFNPHSFEFSRGEEERIAAGVKLCRDSGIDASGPVPADAAFAGLLSPGGSAMRFDGYVSMYHDQAMIPAKLLARGRGVNVTLGLGHVRTSPLHGTAFDISGKGIASPDSMTAAIRLAAKLAGVGS